MHEDFLRIVTLFRQYQDTGEDNYKEQAETLLNLSSTYKCNFLGADNKQ